MSARGVLRITMLTDLFQLISVGRKSGTLTLRRWNRDETSTLIFIDGRIVYVTVSSDERRIGRILMESRKVTSKQVEEALEFQKYAKGGQMLAYILVQKGYLSQGDAIRSLQKQVADRAYKLFEWRKGSFHFDSRLPNLDGYIKLSMNTESLIMEGARRIDEWSQIRQKITSSDVVFTLTSETLLSGTKVDLEPTEWAVLAHIDGKKTVREIAQDMKEDEFGTSKILYDLLVTHNMIAEVEN